MTPMECIIKEIRKGIEEARRKGVVVPHGITDIAITPIKEDNEKETKRV